MKDETIVDILIENIDKDQELLEKAETQIEEAKETKREIVSRMKDYRKDASVLLKYADDERRAKLEKLGFDFSAEEQGMNPVASKALDIIVKAKDNKITNGALYEAYINTFKNKEDAFSYTEFNIKCRSLFNTQRLLRKKGSNPKDTRQDIISLNGKVLKTKDQPIAKK